MKYYIQKKVRCPHCKREDVDAVTTDQEPGLLYSAHFPPGTLKFCQRSLTEIM